VKPQSPYVRDLSQPVSDAWCSETRTPQVAVEKTTDGAEGTAADVGEPLHIHRRKSRRRLLARVTAVYRAGVMSLQLSAPAPIGPAPAGLFLACGTVSKRGRPAQLRHRTSVRLCGSRCSFQFGRVSAPTSRSWCIPRTPHPRGPLAATSIFRRTAR
jgi:hypothetical protein